MTNQPIRKAVGRGTSTNPHNRFELLQVESDVEHLDPTDAEEFQPRKIPTEYYVDQTQSIVTKNDSPDIPFTYSLNPYRGCSHGCSYCYARPYHEFLGMSSGLDFETKILVKRGAPELLRQFLRKKDWRGEVLAMSGVTDCYQQAERHFGVTRGCLEVALDARQPVGIITKNALVLRDLDLLTKMAARNLVCVNMSVTSLDQALTRVMEPRTSTPQARLQAIRALSEAGVPVNVMMAPLIPGLNDTEIADVLSACAEHGAQSAGYTLLRLPHAVKDIFLAWLEEQRPDDAQRVKSRIAACRDGRLNETQFGTRMRGTGIIAQTIADSFAMFRRKFGLDRSRIELNTAGFRGPTTAGKSQLRMF